MYAKHPYKRFTFYPPIEPFEQRMLNCGDDHMIYVEQCGNPNGLPIIVLHGGPGGGCSPFMRRFFDPKYYRIILFDQRGCGRSRPKARIEANTTWHLIKDMETIRQLFGISRWILFGGSWGATLGLIYAIRYPQHVLAQVLRGVFFMTDAELDWFYRGGAAMFWPELWQDFLSPLSEAAQSDPIKGYHKLLFSGDRALENKAARSWTIWEDRLCKMDNEKSNICIDLDDVRAFARLECHYFNALGFLGRQDYIAHHSNNIRHIPTVIVQGRYDMVCPPRAAWHFAQKLENKEFIFVQNSGHALNEPAIYTVLIEQMEMLKTKISY